MNPLPISCRSCIRPSRVVPQGPGLPRGPGGLSQWSPAGRVQPGWSFLCECRSKASVFSLARLCGHRAVLPLAERPWALRWGAWWSRGHSPGEGSAPERGHPHRVSSTHMYPSGGGSSACMPEAPAPHVTGSSVFLQMGNQGTGRSAPCPRLVSLSRIGTHHLTTSRVVEASALSCPPPHPTQHGRSLGRWWSQRTCLVEGPWRAVAVSGTPGRAWTNEEEPLALVTGGD